ncbi:MAG: hypothetical protein J7578_11255 [Chitinophagaceae bacterium]|nr:hypothetical protein [Chitinophagaceae bacterium]
MLADEIHRRFGGSDGRWWVGWGVGAKPGFFACICEASMGYPSDIITLIRQKISFGMRGSFPTTPVVALGMQYLLKRSLCLQHISPLSIFFLSK